jgi:hypothetical protein
MAVAGAIVARAAAGCSSSSAGHDTTAAAGAGTSAAGTSAASSSATSSPAPTYVAALNALCGDLQTKVLAIYGGPGHHTSFPISVFNAEQPKLAAVTRDFDAKADALPVTASDRAAAKAFDAFRRQSDALYRIMAAAAATGKQAKFDAAFAHIVHTFEDKPNPVLDALHAAGIFCNAR